MQIERKYRKPLVGKYNAGIYICPECNTTLLGGYRFGNVYQHIIGFADSHNGNMAMVECPKCFHKWYFHSRLNESSNVYDHFLEHLNMGKTFHFK